MFEINVDPNHGVTANVNLIVDTTNANNVNSSIANITANLEDDWDVVIEHYDITSVPTVAPSAMPSAAPTTLLPSAVPTITGTFLFLSSTQTLFFMCKVWW